MPVASGQLLHAFVFDRDCFPKVSPLRSVFESYADIAQAYGDFILNQTPNYIQARPGDYPADLPWPGRFDIVDSLAKMAKLHYP